MITTARISMMDATHAVTASPIPPGGRRIPYRGHLIHGEVPAICYVIYGRNRYGQLTELGNTRSFADAMRWVDRHLDDMQRLIPVMDEPRPVEDQADDYPMAA